MQWVWGLISRKYGRWNRSFNSTVKSRGTSFRVAACVTSDGIRTWWHIAGCCSRSSLEMYSRNTRFGFCTQFRPSWLKFCVAFLGLFRLLAVLSNRIRPFPFKSFPTHNSPSYYRLIRRHVISETPSSNDLRLYQSNHYYHNMIHQYCKTPLTPWSRVLLEKLIVTQSRNSSPFIHVVKGD
jgi:hypothetical protein